MFKFLKLLVALALMSFISAIPAQAKQAKGGNHNVDFTYYGNASSATTGATDLIFSVPGLLASHKCVVTPVSYGTGPVSWTKAVVTAGVITLTVNANQTAGSTVINFLCFIP